LQVAVKFSLGNSRRGLSQNPATVCVIISKTALKLVFMAFGKELLNHCYVGRKYGSPLSHVIYIWLLVSTLSKTM